MKSIAALLSAASVSLALAEDWAPSHDLRGTSVPMPDERQLQFLAEELNQVRFKAAVLIIFAFYRLLG